MATSQKVKDLSCEELVQSELLGEYLDFLCNHRGLAKNTDNMRRHDVTAFLNSLKFKNDREDITKTSVHQIYDCIMRALKLMMRPTQKQFTTSIRSFLKFASDPRLHDFRHTFATRCLSEAYQAGKNPNATLPLLATYLGHVDIACTQIYLHPASGLLATVGQRFLAHYREADSFKGGNDAGI